VLQWVNLRTPPGSENVFFSLLPDKPNTFAN